MKKEFVQPEIVDMIFTAEDVITASSSSGNTGAFDGEWVTP